MTSIITWYIIGILISALGIFSYEYFYLYDREIEYISTKEIVEDVLLSFLSWLMVVWLIISVIHHEEILIAFHLACFCDQLSA